MGWCPAPQWWARHSCTCRSQGQKRSTGGLSMTIPERLIILLGFVGQTSNLGTLFIVYVQTGIILLDALGACSVDASIQNMDKLAPRLSTEHIIVDYSLDLEVRMIFQVKLLQPRQRIIVLMTQTLCAFSSQLLLYNAALKTHSQQHAHQLEQQKHLALQSGSAAGHPNLEDTNLLTWVGSSHELSDSYPSPGYPRLRNALCQALTMSVIIFNKLHYTWPHVYRSQTLAITANEKQVQSCI